MILYNLKVPRDAMKGRVRVEVDGLTRGHRSSVHNNAITKHGYGSFFGMDLAVVGARAGTNTWTKLALGTGTAPYGWDTSDMGTQIVAADFTRSSLLETIEGEEYQVFRMSATFAPGAFSGMLSEVAVLNNSGKTVAGVLVTNESSVPEAIEVLGDDQVRIVYDTLFKSSFFTEGREEEDTLVINGNDYGYRANYVPLFQRYGNIGAADTRFYGAIPATAGQSTRDNFQINGTTVPSASITKSLTHDGSFDDGWTEWTHAVTVHATYSIASITSIGAFMYTNGDGGAATDPSVVLTFSPGIPKASGEKVQFSARYRIDYKE